MQGLEITTVAGCGINCTYCPQNSFLQKYKSSVKTLTFENFKQAICKIPTTTRIHFTGFSEPFFNKDCFKMAEFSRARGNYIKISTTLYKASPQNISTITTGLYDEIILHLPVDDQAMHLRMDDVYLQNIETCTKSLRPIDAIVFFGNKPHSLIKKHLLDKTKARVIFLKQDNRNWNSRAGHLNYGPINHTNHNKIKCSLNKIEQNVMLPNGDIYLCCMDWGLDHKIGNLFTDTYEDIINSSSYKNILLSLSNNKSGTLCWRCDHARPDE